MRKLLCLCLVLMAAAASQSVFAADAFIESILNSVKMDTDFGPQVDTFEDVKPITGIRASFDGDGPITGQGEISSKFQGFAKKVTADEFFARLNACGGLIFSSGNLDFAGFLADKFYLDSGYMQKDAETGTQVWNDDMLRPDGDLRFPNYTNTVRPHQRIYYMCISDGYEYIKSFEQPLPNRLSCDDHRLFCEYPPCKEKKEEDDPASAGAKITVQEEEHNQTDKNIYKDLADLILVLCHN